MKNKSLCWIINSELFLHVRTCNSISPTETLKITHSLTFIPLLIQYSHLVFTVVHDPLTHKKCQVLIPAVVCCFVLYHVFHLFSLSGMETDTDLHLAPRIHSQEAFKVEFFKCFTGTK